VNANYRKVQSNSLRSLFAVVQSNESGANDL
jgi:hypothetical protein